MRATTRKQVLEVVDQLLADKTAYHADLELLGNIRDFKEASARIYKHFHKEQAEALHSFMFNLVMILQRVPPKKSKKGGGR